jgi:hypothetical protein
MSDTYLSALRRPPTIIPAAPSTTTLAGYTVTGAVSTVALQVIPSAAGFGVPGRKGLWLDFIATGADAFVLFGKSDVAAATTLCMIIPVGTVQPYFCTGDSAFLRVITAGAAGTLRWVPSGQ